MQLLHTDLRVQDTYFQSHMLYETHKVDDIIRGITQQKGKVVEASIVTDLSHKLFVRSSTEAFGLDLVALNVQRGRDHGIPTYMQMRRICQLPVANSFSDLKDLSVMPEEVVDRMASMYRYPTVRRFMWERFYCGFPVARLRTWTFTSADYPKTEMAKELSVKRFPVSLPTSSDACASETASGTRTTCRFHQD